MTLTTIHAGIANAMVLFTLIAGVWGIVAYLRDKGVEGNYWGILAVGELTFLLQAVVGMILLLGAAQLERSVHILYGIVAAITIPAYYAFTRGRDDRQAALMYGILSIFLSLISVRAITTGG
jgi:hypothetical protein